MPFYVNERDGHNPDLLHMFRDEKQALTYVALRSGIARALIKETWDAGGGVDDDDFVTWDVTIAPAVDYDHTNEE